MAGWRRSEERPVGGEARSQEQREDTSPLPDSPPLRLYSGSLHLQIHHLSASTPSRWWREFDCEVSS
uniref:Uncharacterized protein n=2 Tax=Oryza TaxID=4527 RepID=A0A0E0FJ40_ORYNI